MKKEKDPAPYFGLLLLAVILFALIYLNGRVNTLQDEVNLLETRVRMAQGFSSAIMEGTGELTEEVGHLTLTLRNQNELLKPKFLIKSAFISNLND